MFMENTKLYVTIESKYKIGQHVSDTFLGQANGVVIDMKLDKIDNVYYFVYRIKLDSNGELIEINESNLKSIDIISQQ